MNTLPTLNPVDLKPWLNKPEMILACVKQVQKDLGMYGIEISFHGEISTAYECLFNQLQPQIESLLSRGSVTWIDILYRVDVSENKVKELSQGQDSFSAAITHLIIWRELQKVVIRFLLQRDGL